VRDKKPVAAEFERIFERLEGLRPQRIGPSVPEIPMVEGDIEQARGVSGADSEPLGQPSAVGEGAVRLVAGGARDPAVGV
jgi:hypothetical protein